MLSLDVLLIGTCLVAPAAVLIAHYWVGRRWDVALGAVLLMVFFSAAITLVDHPDVTLGVLGAMLAHPCERPAGCGRHPGFWCES